LYILGYISSKTFEAVKVVAKLPSCKAPSTAPAAPPSLCISTICGTVPHRLVRPCADHSSAHSPIAEAGVIGYTAHTSLDRRAIDAVDALPAIITQRVLCMLKSSFDAGAHRMCKIINGR